MDDTSVTEPKAGYPKGHAGRLLITLAAIDELDRPTASSVANRTGLSKGNTDRYVQILNEQFGLVILKEEGVYTLQSWGTLLNKDGVRALLAKL